MKRLLLLLLIACSPVSEKIFVANEEGGSISVIDAVKLVEIERVKLAAEHDGEMVYYAPHNVQVSGDLVLVTSNSGSGDEHEEGSHEEAESEANSHTDLSGIISNLPSGMVMASAHGDEESSEHFDQLVVIDAKSHDILERIDLGVGAHLAHVVSDGKFAYITATNTDELFKISFADWSVSSISLPKGSAPHGLRLGDGFAAIASMDGNLLIVDLNTNAIKSVNVSGMLMQSAIIGDYVFVSVFDKDELARYDVKSGKLDRFKLGNAGPVQLYPSVDGNFIYVADQGNLLGKPVGTNVFKVSVSSGERVDTIESGSAPHGVVVSPNGKVWVTNVLDNTVSMIENDAVLATIHVGVAPNGISFWSRN
ncbi:hypothetical protein J4219_08115 [Candidatus Woesearchaeota archaeon]|nr:hypothetical protein [Candidatus Woesearchaeota archaeon]